LRQLPCAWCNTASVGCAGQLVLVVHVINIIYVILVSCCQVDLWDLNGGKIVRQWEAHEKRIWAVDFNTQQPDTFASGSDDGTVKVWWQ